MYNNKTYTIVEIYILLHINYVVIDDVCRVQTKSVNWFETIKTGNYKIVRCIWRIVIAVGVYNKL